MLAVIFGVRERQNWGTFFVAKEGVRPALIIEVTSPNVVGYRSLCHPCHLS